MGWLSKIGKIGAGLARNPLVKTGLSFGKMVPGLGTVLAAADLASNVLPMFSGGSSADAGGLPALPAPGIGGNSMVGPGGSLQMPGFGASTSAAGTARRLDDRYLKVSYRAPKGYVVMWDGGHHGVGKPFPVLKKDAIHMRYPDGSRVFHPHHKPPISVGQWHALKKAHTTVKKMEKVNKMARHILGSGHHMHVRPKALPAPHRKGK